jgi:hypothetical protein
MTLVLLTAACTTSEDDSSLAEGGSVTVAFDAKMGSSVSQGAATRTPRNAIEDNAALSTKEGFGVFACYTGLHKYEDSNVHPDFMYNEHVFSNDNGATWIYSPLKYWPNGEGEVAGLTGINPHYVSFMAYAPWCDDTHPNYCITSFSLQGEVGNPWLTYRLAYQTKEEEEFLGRQVDLLYATQLDQKKPTIAYRVPFVFNHALACVGDKITIECSSGLKSQIQGRINGTITKAKVVVSSLKIEYTLTSKGRLVLWSKDEANWQTIFSEDPVCMRILNFLKIDDSSDDVAVHTFDSTDKTGGSTGTATPSPHVIEGKGVYYIPAELSNYVQTAVVSVAYHVSTYNGSTWVDDEERTGAATIKLHDYKNSVPEKDAYRSGKHLYINVSLNPMDIALTAAIAPWEDGGTVEVEGDEQ